MSDVVTRTDNFIATHARFLNPWSPQVVDEGWYLDILIQALVFEKIRDIPPETKDWMLVLLARSYSGMVLLKDLDPLLRASGLSESEVSYLVRVIGCGWRLRTLLLREQRMRGQESEE